MGKGEGKTDEEGQSQHWRDLCEALQREARKLGGFGRLVVELSVNGGAPQQMHVIKSEPLYRFGRSQAPLTGKGPLARLTATE